MEDMRTLRFLDVFRKWFERAGIEYSVMRRILKTKLAMDQRRVPTILNDRAKKKSAKEGNQFIKSLWIYVLIGSLLLIPFIVMGSNYVFQMSVVFAMTMFLLMTSMISDFSSVLLDIRDTNILHTKPINQRTLSMAKTLHICIYMFFLTASVTGIPLIVGFAVHGALFFILFACGIFLTDLLVVFITALLYFSILKFFDSEKLKDIINYVQIGFSICIMAGYQVVLRSFEFVDFQAAFQLAWWHYLLPPIWYGAAFEWLLNGQLNSAFVIFTGLAVTVPMLSIVSYIKFMPAFEENLQKLAEHSTRNKKNSMKSISNGIAKLICRHKQERALFHFAGLMMKNEREFKLKVYPSLGFSIVIPFIFIANQLSHQPLEAMGQSKSYLAIYSCLLMIPTIIMTLRYSGKYKGAWIFRITPVSSPAPVITATLKAFIVKLFLPVYLFLSVVFLWIYGIDIWIDLAIVLTGTCLYTVLCFHLLEKFLPFSESFEAFQQTEGWKIIPFILIIGAFAGIHALVMLVSFGPIIYLVFLLLINGVYWRRTFNISWREMSK